MFENIKKWIDARSVDPGFGKKGGLLKKEGAISETCHENINYIDDDKIPSKRKLNAGRMAQEDAGKEDLAESYDGFKNSIERNLRKNSNESCNLNQSTNSSKSSFEFN